MASCKVVNVRAETVGETELDDAIFNIEVNSGILHEVVCMQRAAHRKGNSNTKCKGQVSGSDVKPWRQKGTGRARAGSRTSPLWRGGGVVFGPKRRTYKYSTTKKLKNLALRMALSSRYQEGNLVVLDHFQLEAVKTKEFVSVLRGLEIANCLIVVETLDKNLDLSSRNVVGSKVLTVAGLNVYDILDHTKLVLVQGSIPEIGRRLVV